MFKIWYQNEKNIKTLAYNFSKLVPDRKKKYIRTLAYHFYNLRMKNVTKTNPKK